jgi:hypothetical protein
MTSCLKHYGIKEMTFKLDKQAFVVKNGEKQRLLLCREGFLFLPCNN